VRTQPLCAMLVLLVALETAMAASLHSTASGTATTTIETKTVQSAGRLGGPQPCAGVSMPTAVVYYQSKSNFKGMDQFKYQRINQDNPNDRLNGEVVLTVTVK
jgi:hypothetical protein